MASKSWAVCLVVAIAATAAGCGDSGGGGGGSGGGGVVGTYTMDVAAIRKELEAEMKKNTPEGPAGDMAKQVFDQMVEGLTKADMKLELRADKSFLFSAKKGEGAAASTAKGTWKQEGDKIHFTTTEVDGKPAEESDEVPPVTVKAGQLLIETVPGGPVIVLKKK